MRKFLMLQLWLGIIIIGLYFVYKRTIGKDDTVAAPPASLELAPAKGTLPENYVRAFPLPGSLFFAGERVPLELPDVQERLDRELHLNSYWHSSTILLLKKSNRWLPRLEAILTKNGLPSDFKYLAVIESGLENVISPANAAGFWQITEAAGKELGLEINEEVDQRYDPVASSEAACRYLLKARERVGSWTNAAAAYNMGMKGFANKLEEQRVDSYYHLHLNAETSRYIFRILAVKEIMESPQKYGYNISAELLYPVLQSDTLRITEDIADLVDFARKRDLTYREIKLHNPWLRQKSLTVKKGKTYLLSLPAKTKQPANARESPLQ